MKMSCKEMMRMMTLLGICSSSAYPFSDERWKFLGIEESHCYDKYMISDLKQAAFQTAKPRLRVFFHVIVYWKLLFQPSVFIKEEHRLRDSLIRTELMLRRGQRSSILRVSSKGLFYRLQQGIFSGHDRLNLFFTS
jgi:hypothetical protein